MRGGGQRHVVTLIGGRIIPTVNYARPVTITLYATGTTAALNGHPRHVRMHLDPGVLGGTVNINVPKANVVKLPVTISLNTLVKGPRCRLRILGSLAPSSLRLNGRCVRGTSVGVGLGRNSMSGLCVRMVYCTNGNETATVVTNSRAGFICMRHGNRIIFSGHNKTTTSIRGSSVRLGLHLICRFTAATPLSRVHFVLGAGRCGVGTTRRSVGNGCNRYLNGAVSHPLDHNVFNGGVFSRVLSHATSTYSTQVNKTVVPIVDGDNDNGRNVYTAGPIIICTLRGRGARRRLVHTLVLDRLATVCVGRDLNGLSTLYNYIMTDANDDYNVACLVNNSFAHVYGSIGGVITGLANVVYSKTGPDYTLGVSSNIDATLLSTLLSVRNGYMASTRNVISSSISGYVRGLASVNTSTVGAASSVILSVVARGWLNVVARGWVRI